MKHFPQKDADALLKMEKQPVDDRVWHYPPQGQTIIIPLRSADEREEFILDIKRYRIDLERRTYQNRARQSIILGRVDIRGPLHENPDGETIGLPHIHVYREGYGDKWAYPLPPEVFKNPDDPMQILDDFLVYCRVTPQPRFVGSWC